MTSSTVLPETFTRAVTDLRAVRPRAEIAVEEIPPPRRLAPFAYAISATVRRQADQGLRASGGRGVLRGGRTGLGQDQQAASGRLILLHDPDGHEAWGPGTLRLVTYVSAELEADLAADPLLPTVGWSWLVDALDAHEAAYTALGGTVTETTSTPFGELASRTSQRSGELASRSAQHSGELASRTSQRSGELASRTSQRSGELASRSAQHSGELAGRSGQSGGELAEPAATTDLELRASWTPLSELGAHMRAWCTLLASAAGLPPPGVTVLRV